MSDRPAPLRLGVPPLAAASRLAHAWQRGSLAIGSVETVALIEAEGALRAGRVDVAFVPALAVLRAAEAFSAVPGVALVGRAGEGARLHLPAGLAALRPGARPRVGLDPRRAQEAVLVQVILKEAYGAHPQFVPVPSAGASGQPLDAYLLPPEAPLPDGGTTLDLGQEWFELTARPMVWALLVTTAGGLEPAEAQRFAEIAADVQGPETPPDLDEPASVTLGAYAHAGLDAFIHHLFYHRAIDHLVEVPFIETGDDETEHGE